jgi:aromatic ring-opening dioxygenase catalytic subunit (LigB family)
MPLTIGLGCAHAPSIFAPTTRWAEIHSLLTKGVPQPPGLALETDEVIEAQLARALASFETLKERLRKDKPDALVIVGDDQHELFSKAFMPALGVFVGGTARGTTAIRMLGQKLEETLFEISCHAELSKLLARGLLEEGFDVAVLEELQPLGRPQGGIGHAFSWPAKALALSDLKIPIVPVFVAADEFPALTGERCFALGRAIARVFENRPERIAILASGGLSHDPHGPRAGWVDEALDRWVLGRLEAGDSESLTHLFTFDTDTLHGGTGEIRMWITVGGAMGRRTASILDYIPSVHAVTGMAFACWDMVAP